MSPIWIFIGGVFCGFMGGVGLMSLAQIAREVEEQAAHLRDAHTINKRLETLRGSPNQWP